VGLGLYIVKKFADLLAAEVTVESELGRGSRFTLTVPMGTEDEDRDVRSRVDVNASLR